MIKVKYPTIGDVHIVDGKERIQLKYNNRYGVPCSKLKDWLTGNEVPCTNEAEAMAMAAGAWFAGKEPEVYMQNSGLGHIVDVVFSLYFPYEIPLPELYLSVRNSPYHHQYMYERTQELLELLEYDNVKEILQQYGYYKKNI